MIKDGDKIAVCISGGKDSMLLAKLFQELYRHGKRNFGLVFLCMNPQTVDLRIGLFGTVSTHRHFVQERVDVFEDAGLVIEA